METLCSTVASSNAVNFPLPCRSATTTSSSSLAKIRSFPLLRLMRPKKLKPLALSTSPGSPRRRWAAPRVVSGRYGINNGTPMNGFSVLADDGTPLFENDIMTNESDEAGITLVPKTLTPVARGTGMNEAKAGLFRAPISGGKKSATVAHDLPKPVLAVRNLVEQASFAHLSTIMSPKNYRSSGYPVGSLVDYAPDAVGHPILSLSTLAIHTRNLLESSKCSLVIQIPGWVSLLDARVTIFGEIYPLPLDQKEWACKLFSAKHHQWPTHQWGNFNYYRMHTISDIYFIGGFGTIEWINVQEYESTKPDKITADGEQTLKEINAIFSKPLKEILSMESEIDDAAFISIDSKGADIRVRQGAQFSIQRLSFGKDHIVQNCEEAKEALRNIIFKHCMSK